MKVSQPLTVKIFVISMLLNAFIWLSLGILILGNLHFGLPDDPRLKVVLAILSFILACVLCGLVYYILKSNHIAYYLTLLTLFGTALLTIFDDFGIADLIVLILNILPIFLLIKDHKWYFQAGAAVGRQL